MKRDLITLPLDLGSELIIDNFAGGGGTSTGLERAFGRPVDVAINHDPEALAMHALNHPYTKHLCESVWDVDPIEVTNNQPVGLVWLSPDCKHFSKAKGGTPVAKNIRGLAWVGMRWIALTKPRVLMLENVEEFQEWGPLIFGEDGTARPDPNRKGKTFRSFVRQLRMHGYDVGWRESRACDDGAPTIRKRLFLVARRDRLPIVFPAPTHADPTSREVLAGALAPYRSAAECIDFGIEAKSIFGRKKPHVPNTQRRVAKGLWRHVFASESPYIVDQGAHAITPLRGTSEAHLTGHSIERPLSTVSAGGTHHALTSAHLITIGYGERPGQDARAQDLRAALGTVVAANKHALVSAHITKFRAGSAGSSMDEPMPTVTANSFVKRPGGSAPLGLVAAQLMHVTHHGERAGSTPAHPLPTITGAHRGEQALAAAFFEQANGGFWEDNDGHPATAPLSTITSRGANQRLVTAYLVKYYSSGGQWQELGVPMHTLPTKGRMGLVQAIQMPADCLAEEHHAKARQCAEFLREYLSEHFPNDADMILMFHDGAWWVLVDITLRMLKARELYRAQSFPESYIIHEIPDPKLLFKDGVQVSGDPRLIPRIPLSITAQIRLCGNSVCPDVATALIRANFAHEKQMSGVVA